MATSFLQYHVVKALPRDALLSRSLRHLRHLMATRSLPAPFRRGASLRCAYSSISALCSTFHGIQISSASCREHTSSRASFALGLSAPCPVYHGTQIPPASCPRHGLSRTLAHFSILGAVFLVPWHQDSSHLTSSIRLLERHVRIARFSAPRPIYWAPSFLPHHLVGMHLREPFERCSTLRDHVRRSSARPPSIRYEWLNAQRSAYTKSDAFSVEGVLGLPWKCNFKIFSKESVGPKVSLLRICQE